MKVITLRQPWAYFLCAGIKTIETRSFNTSHRGPLLIHASAHVPTKAEVTQYETDPAFAVHRQHAFNLFGPGIVRGAIIGCVNVIDTKPAEDWRAFFDNMKGSIADYNYTDSLLEMSTSITQCELSLGDYSAGRYGWLTAQARLYTKAVPAKGALSLWNTWNRNALDINACTVTYYGEFLSSARDQFWAKCALADLKRTPHADLQRTYPDIYKRARIIEDKLFPTFKY